MRRTNEMKARGKLKPEYRQAWADYFVRYIKAYAAEGLPVWGITVQNERWRPRSGSRASSPPPREGLRPRLPRARAAQERPRRREGDDLGSQPRHHVPAGGGRLRRPRASKYIWGMAFPLVHRRPLRERRMVHDAYPDKASSSPKAPRAHLAVCNEAGQAGHPCDLNNWTSAWTIWNIAARRAGRPAPRRRIDGRHGRQRQPQDGELTFNPPHYVFGQFTRFIRPGARRIACTSNSDDFVATAFVKHRRDHRRRAHQTPPITSSSRRSGSRAAR